MKFVEFPSILDDNYVLGLIDKLSFANGMDGRRLPGVKLDFHRVINISLLCQVVIYKFISYSCKKRYFHNPMLQYSDALKFELEKYGFGYLINEHMKEKIFSKTLPDKIKTVFEDKFFIAPLVIDRESRDNNKLEQHLKKIKIFYNHDQNVVKLLSQCFVEIYNNFLAHASRDTATIIVARGDRNSFQIIMADSGQGIITNLRNSGCSHPSNLLNRAIEKGVTSKKNTAHMGYGLWIIYNICKLNNGRLNIISEGKHIKLLGKQKTDGRAGNWDGTIINLEIPITDSIILIDTLFDKSKTKAKINWR